MGVCKYIYVVNVAIICVRVFFLRVYVCMYTQCVSVHCMYVYIYIYIYEHIFILDATLVLKV